VHHSWYPVTIEFSYRDRGVPIHRLCTTECRIRCFHRAVVVVVVVADDDVAAAAAVVRNLWAAF